MNEDQTVTYQIVEMGKDNTKGKKKNQIIKSVFFNIVLIELVAMIFLVLYMLLPEDKQLFGVLLIIAISFIMMCLTPFGSCTMFDGYYVGDKETFHKGKKIEKVYRTIAFGTALAVILILMRYAVA